MKQTHLRGIHSKNSFLSSGDNYDQPFVFVFQVSSFRNIVANDFIILRNKAARLNKLESNRDKVAFSSVSPSSSVPLLPSICKSDDLSLKSVKPENVCVEPNSTDCVEDAEAYLMSIMSKIPPNIIGDAFTKIASKSPSKLGGGAIKVVTRPLHAQKTFQTSPKPFHSIPLEVLNRGMSFDMFGDLRKLPASSEEYAAVARYATNKPSATYIGTDTNTIVPTRSDGSVLLTVFDTWADQALNEHIKKRKLLLEGPLFLLQKLIEPTKRSPPHNQSETTAGWADSPSKTIKNHEIKMSRDRKDGPDFNILDGLFQKVLQASPSSIVKNSLRNDEKSDEFRTGLRNFHSCKEKSSTSESLIDEHPKLKNGEIEFQNEVDDNQWPSSQNNEKNSEFCLTSEISAVLQLRHPMNLQNSTIISKKYKESHKKRRGSALTSPRSLFNTSAIGTGQSSPSSQSPRHLNNIKNQGDVDYEDSDNSSTDLDVDSLVSFDEELDLLDQEDRIELGTADLVQLELDYGKKQVEIVKGIGAELIRQLKLISSPHCETLIALMNTLMTISNWSFRALDVCLTAQKSVAESRIEQREELRKNEHQRHNEAEALRKQTEEEEKQRRLQKDLEEERRLKLDQSTGAFASFMTEVADKRRGYSKDQLNELGGHLIQQAHNNGASMSFSSRPNVGLNPASKNVSPSVSKSNAFHVTTNSTNSNNIAEPAFSGIPIEQSLINNNFNNLSGIQNGNNSAGSTQHIRTISPVVPILKLQSGPMTVINSTNNPPAQIYSERTQSSTIMNGLNYGRDGNAGLSHRSNTSTSAPLYFKDSNSQLIANQSYKTSFAARNLNAKMSLKIHQLLLETGSLSDVITKRFDVGAPDPSIVRMMMNRTVQEKGLSCDSMYGQDPIAPLPLNQLCLNKLEEQKSKMIAAFGYQQQFEEEASANESFIKQLESKHEARIKLLEADATELWRPTVDIEIKYISDFMTGVDIERLTSRSDLLHQLLQRTNRPTLKEVVSKLGKSPVEIRPDMLQWVNTEGKRIFDRHDLDHDGFLVEEEWDLFVEGLLDIIRVISPDFDLSDEQGASLRMSLEETFEQGPSFEAVMPLLAEIGCLVDFSKRGIARIDREKKHEVIQRANIFFTDLKGYSDTTRVKGNLLISLFDNIKKKLQDFVERACPFEWSDKVDMVTGLTLEELFGLFGPLVRVSFMLEGFGGVADLTMCTQTDDYLMGGFKGGKRGLGWGSNSQSNSGGLNQRREALRMAVNSMIHSSGGGVSLFDAHRVDLQSLDNAVAAARGGRGGAKEVSQDVMRGTILKRQEKIRNQVIHQEVNPSSLISKIGTTSVSELLIPGVPIWNESLILSVISRITWEKVALDSSIIFNLGDSLQPGSDSSRLLAWAANHPSGGKNLLLGPKLREVAVQYIARASAPFGLSAMEVAVRTFLKSILSLKDNSPRIKLFAKACGLCEPVPDRFADFFTYFIALLSPHLYRNNYLNGNDTVPYSLPPIVDAKSCKIELKSAFSCIDAIFSHDWMTHGFLRIPQPYSDLAKRKLKTFHQKALQEWLGQFVKPSLKKNLIAPSTQISNLNALNGPSSKQARTSMISNLFKSNEIHQVRSTDEDVEIIPPFRSPITNIISSTIIPSNSATSAYHAVIGSVEEIIGHGLVPQHKSSTEIQAHNETIRNEAESAIAKNGVRKVAESYEISNWSRGEIPIPISFDSVLDIAIECWQTEIERRREILTDLVESCEFLNYLSPLKSKMGSSDELSSEHIISWNEVPIPLSIEESFKFDPKYQNQTSIFNSIPVPLTLKKNPEVEDNDMKPIAYGPAFWRGGGSTSLVEFHHTLTLLAPEVTVQKSLEIFNRGLTLQKLSNAAKVIDDQRANYPFNGGMRSSYDDLDEGEEDDEDDSDNQDVGLMLMNMFRGRRSESANSKNNASDPSSVNKSLKQKEGNDNNAQEDDLFDGSTFRIETQFLVSALLDESLSATPANCLAPYIHASGSILHHGHTERVNIQKFFFDMVQIKKPEDQTTLQMENHPDDPPTATMSSEQSAHLASFDNSGDGIGVSTSDKSIYGCNRSQMGTVPIYHRSILDFGRLDELLSSNLIGLTSQNDIDDHRQKDFCTSDLMKSNLKYEGHVLATIHMHQSTFESFCKKWFTEESFNLEARVKHLFSSAADNIKQNILQAISVSPRIAPPLQPHVYSLLREPGALGEAPPSPCAELLIVADNAKRVIEKAFSIWIKRSQLRINRRLNRLQARVETARVRQLQLYHNAAVTNPGLVSSNKRNIPMETGSGSITNVTLDDTTARSTLAKLLAWEVPEPWDKNPKVFCPTKSRKQFLSQGASNSKFLSGDIWPGSHNNFFLELEGYKLSQQQQIGVMAHLHKDHRPNRLVFFKQIIIQDIESVERTLHALDALASKVINDSIQCSKGYRLNYLDSLKEDAAQLRAAAIVLKFPVSHIPEVDPLETPTFLSSFLSRNITNLSLHGKNIPCIPEAQTLLATEDIRRNPYKLGTVVLNTIASASGGGYFSAPPPLQSLITEYSNAFAEKNNDGGVRPGTSPSVLSPLGLPLWPFGSGINAFTGLSNNLSEMLQGIGSFGAPVTSLTSLSTQNKHENK